MGHPASYDATAKSNVAGLIERRGIYYAQFDDATRTPGRKRASLKTKRKGIARRLLAQLERDYEAGKYDPWFDDPFAYKREPDQREDLTITAALERFLDAKRSQERSDNTVSTYRAFVGQLARRLPLRRRRRDRGAGRPRGRRRRRRAAIDSDRPGRRSLSARSGSSLVWCSKSR